MKCPLPESSKCILRTPASTMLSWLFKDLLNGFEILLKSSPLLKYGGDKPINSPLFLEIVVFKVEMISLKQTVFFFFFSLKNLL